MPGNDTLIEKMMDAILTGNTGTAASLCRTKPGGFSPEEQLLVYIRGYRKRLKQVLDQTYSALRYYMGERAYQSLTDSYISSHVSRHHNRHLYAAGLKDHVCRISKDECVRDLAKIESMMSLLYQKEETAALTLQWLEQQTPETLTNTRFQLRIASCLAECNCMVAEFINALQKGQKPEKPCFSPSYLMVLRDNARVNCIALVPPEYRLLGIIAEGNPLGNALNDVRFAPYAADKNFASDFQGWFLRWVNEGFFMLPG